MIKYLVAIVIVLAILASLSCKKEVTNIYQQGIENNTGVIDSTYISKNKFTMIERPPTGEGNGIRIWILQDKNNVKLTITNVDPALFWKYNVSDIVPSQIVWTVYKKQ